MSGRALWASALLRALLQASAFPCQFLDSRIQMRKGNTMQQFLQKALEILRKDFSELRCEVCVCARWCVWHLWLQPGCQTPSVMWALSGQASSVLGTLLPKEGVRLLFPSLPPERALLRAACLGSLAQRWRVLGASPVLTKPWSFPQSQRAAASQPQHGLSCAGCLLPPWAGVLSSCPRPPAFLPQVCRGGAAHVHQGGLDHPSRESLQPQYPQWVQRPGLWLRLVGAVCAGGECGEGPRWTIKTPLSCPWLPASQLLRLHRHQGTGEEW